MAAVTTVDQFLKMVRQSGVLDSHRLEAHLQALSRAHFLCRTPTELARRLVADGLLTSFQADQFLRGKWRGFLISGKYKLLEFLGSGGMGNVFLCEHIYLRRLVAVKVLPTSQTCEPSVIERFYREARAAATLDHPNIVRAFDVDYDGSLHFMVMEYVDGTNLQRLVRKRGPLEINRAGHYICQAALGLQHAYEVGWIHRDIKPANLLVDRQGVVKILDMGLARLFQDEVDPTGDIDQNCVMGTADFLAPEQTLGNQDVDIRCDIYSLGATFYYCVTGRPPFDEGTVNQKLVWHQVRQPKRVRSLRPDLPEAIAAVIEKMMAKDPQRRYQTPAAVIDALVPLVQMPVALPLPEEMPPISRVVQHVSQLQETAQSSANRIALPSGKRKTGLRLPASPPRRTVVLKPPPSVGQPPSTPPPTPSGGRPVRTAATANSPSGIRRARARTTQLAPPHVEPVPLPPVYHPERTTRSEADRPTVTEFKVIPHPWPWWLKTVGGLLLLAGLGLTGWMIFLR
jgi:serine/threonine protein kinase